MTVPEKIRESFYDEVPFTFDHEDLDLAYPLVSENPLNEDGITDPMFWIGMAILVAGIALSVWLFPL